MNRHLALACACAAGILGGCGGMAPLMSMPETPNPTVDTVTTTVAFSNQSDLDENVVQLAAHEVKVGSTVVINVPSGLVNDDSRRGASDEDFKTKDFFNEAEQEIEKVFIRNGFRVLSRAKFEAKLRNLRDEARCDFNEYRCLYSSVAPEARPVLDELKSKFDNKKITAVEYADQIKQFKDQMQTASAGKSRQENEKELTDISEVIRAAQSGDIRADYILQINVFDTKKRLKISSQ